MLKAGVDKYINFNTDGNGGAEPIMWMSLLGKKKADGKCGKNFPTAVNIVGKQSMSINKEKITP